MASKKDIYGFNKLDERYERNMQLYGNRFGPDRSAGQDTARRGIWENKDRNSNKDDFGQRSGWFEGSDSKNANGRDHRSGNDRPFKRHADGGYAAGPSKQGRYDNGGRGYGRSNDRSNHQNRW